MRGLLAAVLCLAACQQLDATFRCGATASCGAGTCEPSGYCSFDDTGCASGRRYGAAADPELANMCVAEGEPDAGGGVDDGPPIDVLAPVDGAPPPRTTRGIALFYPFVTDSADPPQVVDLSGYGTPLNLTVTATVEVTGGDAIFDGDGPIVSAVTASKVVTACETSDETTIEAWVTPASSLADGNSHAITGLMLDVNTRNVALLEDSGLYEWDLRSEATTTGSAFGTMRSPSGLLRTSPTHLVGTREADGTRVFYVDGEAVATTEQPGELDPWSTYRVYVGNNPDGTAPYRGRVHLVAYYCAALTATEVKANYDAGPNAGDL